MPLSSHNLVTWVIQTNLINQDQSKRVWEGALASGAQVREAIVIPFQDTLDNEEDLSDLSGLVIPYGSCKLSKLAQHQNWLGDCYNPQTFRVDVWGDNRSDMLNQSPFIMEAGQTKDFFKSYPSDQLWFIRPVHDLKDFAGTIAPTSEIIKWMESVYSGNFSFSKNTLVAVSPPQKILAEARFFIVDNNVVDGSFYRQNQILKSSHVACPILLEQAQQLANKWLPHPCCVMDVAQTENGLKVIEFNTINSSGFYEHDIEKVVSAMTSYCAKLAPKKNLRL